MRKHFYLFLKDGKIIHSITIPAMDKREYENFMREFYAGSEYKKYWEMADDMRLEGEVDEDYIIEQYKEIMLKRIDDNCDYYEITPCEKKLPIGLFNNQSKVEIIKNNGIEDSTFRAQKRSLFHRLSLKNQHVNTLEKLLRILLRKPEKDE